MQCGYLDRTSNLCMHAMADAPGDPRRNNDCPFFALADARDVAAGTERPNGRAFDPNARLRARRAWDALWR